MTRKFLRGSARRPSTPSRRSALRWMSSCEWGAKHIVIAAVAGTIAITGCGGSSSTSTTTSAAARSGGVTTVEGAQLEELRNCLHQRGHVASVYPGQSFGQRTSGQSFDYNYVTVTVYPSINGAEAVIHPGLSLAIQIRTSNVVVEHGDAIRGSEIRDDSDVQACVRASETG